MVPIHNVQYNPRHCCMAIEYLFASTDAAITNSTPPNINNKMWAQFLEVNKQNTKQWKNYQNPEPKKS